MKMNYLELIRTASENLKDTLTNLSTNEQDLNLLIHNRQELVFWLETIDWRNQRQCEAEEIFFLMEKNGQVEPVYFDYDEEENSWYEHHCTHECREIPEEEIPEFVAYYYTEEDYSYALELAKAMYRDGVQHRIACYTCSPFLDGEFKIIRILSEVECLDWLLEYEREHQITAKREFVY